MKTYEMIHEISDMAEAKWILIFQKLRLITWMNT